MNKRIADKEAPFQTISEVSRITGLSRDFIRHRVKEGRIPYIRGGSRNSAYMINLPKFLELLDAESRSNTETTD